MSAEKPTDAADEPTGPVELEDLGTAIQFFEYRDMPARKLSSHHMPQVYRWNTGWTNVESSWDFMHNYIPATRERIKEMIAELHSS